MSESNEHRGLVLLMAYQLQFQYPNILVETDLQMEPGESVPRIINGHRPDIYAYSKDKSFCIIGEAKTGTDLDNKHTHAQITSFTRHLEAKYQGIFVLGISGRKADRAKTLLRFLCKEQGLAKTSLRVFDGCDYWTLDKKEGVQWHLS